MSRSSTEIYKEQFEALMGGESGQLAVSASANTAASAAQNSITLLLNNIKQLQTITLQLDNDLTEFHGKRNRILIFKIKKLESL